MEPAKASFELNEDMLSLIGKEFSVEQVVERFARAIAGKRSDELESIAQDIFTRYGVDWIRKSRQLGEEYTDRTYEVLEEANDATGGDLWFPLIPQRFLEIAYLSTQDMENLPVIENNPQRLVYKIDTCRMFQALEKACGEDVANSLPCRHACLSAVRTLFQDLDLQEVLVGMEATSDKDGACQFVVARL